MRTWHHPTHSGRRERGDDERRYLPFHPRQRATNPQSFPRVQHATGAPCIGAVIQARACAPADCAQGYTPLWTSGELWAALSGERPSPVCTVRLLINQPTLNRHSPAKTPFSHFSPSYHKHSSSKGWCRGVEPKGAISWSI